MIIKSLSRKIWNAQSFQQLYDYITRESDCDSNYNFTQNFFADDRASVLSEFSRNAELLPARKNWNYLYHEIISFTRSTQLSEDQQKEILRTVCLEYLQKRGEGCLAFGGIHHDKKQHIHAHIILSANKYGSSRRHSLNKSSFKQIKHDLEAKVLQHYPAMEQDRIMSRDPIEQADLSKPLDEKQAFVDRLEIIMQQCSNEHQFKKLLDYHAIAYRFTAKNITLTNPDARTKNNKHRLKTLGLQDLYEDMIVRGQAWTIQKPISWAETVELVTQELEPEDLHEIEALEPWEGTQSLWIIDEMREKVQLILCSSSVKKYRALLDVHIIQKMKSFASSKGLFRSSRRKKWKS